MEATMPPTHEVVNQVPPLTGYDVADDPAMLDALRREGPAGPRRRCARSASSPAPRGPRTGPARERAPARAAHPRPVRPSRRRGRIPPSLARADERGRRRGPARRAVAGHPPGRARGPGREVLPVGPDRRGALLPRLHDVRDRPGPAECTRSGPAVRAAADVHRLRPGAAPAGGQTRPDRRHVDDREAGRLRRPRQHHAGGRGAGGWAGRGEKLPAHRAQVVHLGADERRVRCRAGRPPCGAPFGFRCPAG